MDKMKEMTAYVKMTEKKTLKHIGCQECRKIMETTTYVGSPMMCEKHRAEAVIERLGGKVVWSR
jgi:hypothetical protein